MEDTSAAGSSAKVGLGWSLASNLYQGETGAQVPSHTAAYWSLAHREPEPGWGLALALQPKAKVLGLGRGWAAVLPPLTWTRGANWENTVLV